MDAICDVLGWYQSSGCTVQKVHASADQSGAMDKSIPYKFAKQPSAYCLGVVYRRVKDLIDNALFVYMDAGIGGGLMSSGRLMRGHNGFAGEIGHIHFGEHGFETHTPVQGSFESYVGRNAMLALNRTHVGKSKTLEEFMRDLGAQKPAAPRTVAQWAWWMDTVLRP